MRVCVKALMVGTDVNESKCTELYFIKEILRVIYMHGLGMHKLPESQILNLSLLNVTQELFGLCIFRGVLPVLSSPPSW